MRITETCSCGASLDVVPETASYLSRAARAAECQYWEDRVKEWRENHICPKRVAMTPRMMIPSEFLGYSLGEIEAGLEFAKARGWHPIALKER